MGQDLTVGPRLLYPEVASRIEQMILDGRSVIRVDGAPGTGKSQLLAHVHGRLQTVGCAGGAQDAAAVALASKLLTSLDANGHRLVPRESIRRETDSAVAAIVAESLLAQLETAVPRARAPVTGTIMDQLRVELDEASEFLEETMRRLVIIVDGIDQLEGEGAAALAALFSPRPGVTVLCATRHVHDGLAFMECGLFARIDLNDSATAREACRRAFATALAKVRTGVDVERAIEVSCGNLRYAHDLMTMLAERPRAPLERVPYNTWGYLEEVWDDVVGTTSPDDREALIDGLRVLCRTNATAMTAAAIAFGAGWAGADDPRCLAFLRRARAVLRDDGATPASRYALFVPAFAELVCRKLAEAHSAIQGDNARDAGTREPRWRAPTFLTRKTSGWYALLVGVDQFVESELSLKYCVNDVQALGVALSSVGYNVSLLHDRQEHLRLRPTLLNVRAALAGLKGRLDMDALLWVHFSTHGRLVRRRPVLLASDSRTSDPKGSMLPVEVVLKLMRQSGARRRFLSLDACHAGVQLGRDAGPEHTGLDPGFVHYALDLAEGEYVLATSSSSQDSQDWAERQMGVGTAFMVDGISGRADVGGDGVVTADELRDYVVAGVRGWTFSHQKQLQLPTAEARVDGALILADRRLAASVGA